MRILADIGHPAHLHYFKNVIWNLEKHGHDVRITARDKDVTLKLLDAYGFEYVVIGSAASGLAAKAYSILKKDYMLLKIAREFKPDIFLSFSSPYAAHVSRLMRRPHVAFTDTEQASLVIWLTFPFTDVICTPSCYRRRLNHKKHVRFDGYFELAYLHPRYFKPDDAVLDYLGVSKNDNFIILRFISWSAHHDVDLKGLKKGEEAEFIKALEEFGRVFITSERKLSKELEKYRLTVPPHKIHSLLYYASLYIGEGGTMATEAAILGTPSIHIESTSKGIATGELSGNFLELRNKYGLLYFYPDQNQALEKAIRILEDKNSKNEWRKKKERLLRDKIDVTTWMTEFIERYPDSFYEYKEKHDNF